MDREGMEKVVHGPWMEKAVIDHTSRAKRKHRGMHRDKERQTKQQCASELTRSCHSYR
jgi:hypothetical protein